MEVYTLGLFAAAVTGLALQPKWKYIGPQCRIQGKPHPLGLHSGQVFGFAAGPQEQRGELLESRSFGGGQFRDWHLMHLSPWSKWPLWCRAASREGSRNTAQQFPEVKAFLWSG